MLTFEQVQNNPAIRTYIQRADESLIALGFTEHSFAHVGMVARNAAYILETLGYPQRTVEVAKIAAFLHDIGNLVNRVDHSQSGAVMAFRILDNMDCPPEEIATIVTAIGNHDEGTAFPANAVAAALILDLLMGLAERYLNSRSSQRSKGSRYAARGAAVLSAAAAVVLCVYAFLPKSTEGLLLYEGQYSEIKLVNSMIKQLVEDRHDLTVTIQDEMTAVNNFNALTGDDHTCDLMYTWDGTLLTTIMGLDTTDIPDGQTLYDFVNEKMNDEYDMHMLGKIGVNNTYILGVTQEVVDTYNPKTISDLVPIAGELRFGAEQDFFTDAGNMKFGPMAEAYGLEFAEVKPVDIMMKYTLVEQGAYDVMVVYATDGLNKRANLTLLEDDQHFFPDYYGTILVRNDVFERFADQAPGLEDTLKLLNNQFTDEMMSELTYYVDVEGRDVDEVAHEFLVSAGLLEE